MKDGVLKGFLLWITNNVLALATVCQFIVCLKEPSVGVILLLLLYGIPWLITGGVIVGLVVYYFSSDVKYSEEIQTGKSNHGESHYEVG